ncbi:UDP-N-acetylglucosamine-N-acetylmuramylpentapeptide N-acetylglucosamine transferase [Orbus hercynius]|uniref:UDP-N-acetylglucosamine--N-acetylmuramyl-(pentapeptide) pyrophosphoryl-undecaprenol N-acetylglucosamine transferase n=1 Tax=Orbus hercynius TaxID=593135 RepID=A0A495RI43_9GAMM|nr:undecaprenyldiphospho-muramoylpentapeptide beta-N-acetylglucosaminyltransferase [Orbus hercynius]RKS86944.1 UDP-N-acetylglucosamine-N-acetylmuramylpentapeptide N-acetylglucosamine transferase [Orbus hercynius]
MIKKILIMAGGTGGHVFPGLAVAQELIQQGWQVRWLGTADRMEAQLVPQHGIDIDFITISAIRGKGILAKLLAPIRIFKAVIQARKIIKIYQPDVVLGMGGYVSGPGGLAAKLCGIPVVLHEQNGIAGLTNQWLSKIATVVLQAFPSAFKDAKVVGNPVRTDILSLPSPQERFTEHQGKLRILVMGGSQGAKILNEVIPVAFKQVADRFEIWHQTGKGSQDKVLSAYEGIDMTHNKVSEFIDDVAEAYRWADLIICRSGALTVSEIQVVGLGAIFVPFMHKDRQQYWNAKLLQDIGAAQIIEQIHFTSDKLVTILTSLDRNQLLSMANKASSLAIKDSALEVAQAINDCVTQP